MKEIVFENAESVVQVVLEAINVKSLPMQNVVLLALGRESVECAYELAKKLKVPMDFLFTQTISATNNPECSIAIVSESMEIVINENLINAFEITLDYVYGEAKRQYEESILPSRYRLRQGKELISLKEKDVLLFDMGVETGFRMSVGIKTCMNMQARSLTAITPVMPKDIYKSLSEICDEVYCPYPLDYYVSVAHYFPYLAPLSDDEFEAILNQDRIKDAQ